MIRSPISADERLRNRVETLEHRVTSLERTLTTSVTALYELTRQNAAAVSDTRLRVSDNRDVLDEIGNALDFLAHAARGR